MSKKVSPRLRESLGNSDSSLRGITANTRTDSRGSATESAGKHATYCRYKQHMLTVVTSIIKIGMDEKPNFVMKQN